MEHPMIKEIMKTGYPNMLAQPENCGIDWFGDEVLEGDDIILLPNGEMILENRLEEFLAEVLGFEFTTAK